MAVDEAMGERTGGLASGEGLVVNVDAVGWNAVDQIGGLGSGDTTGGP